MNVADSKNITNMIQYLRKNIYGTDEFKEKFKNELKNISYAIDTEFVPDQFGGWQVNTIINRNKGFEDGIKDQASNNYTPKVHDALMNTIRSIDKTVIPSDQDINLANTIITGPDSIMIKI